MKWFEGNINEAVAASKAKKAIFVVFVEGKDEASEKITKVIDSDEVSTRLQNENFVAIKLESGSESYGFFEQIYKLVPVPSLFFIGQNGSPLEVVAGDTSIPDLCARIDSVISASDPKSTNASTSLISSEQTASSSQKAPEPESIPVGLDEKNSATNILPTSESTEQIQAEPVASSTQSDVHPTTNVPSPDTNTALEQSESSVAGSTSSKNVDQKSELSPDDKVERARRLIELQKRQREEEESRKEREREIQRRKMGQEMAKMKQKQQELEIKQAHEERMREKAAEAAARLRVRQQIAQDRWERKEREQQQQQYLQQTTTTQETPKPRTPESGDSTHARIQFRLPSGSSHMGRFESTSTLGAMRTYILENIEMPFREFALFTSYPRREFTSGDDTKTLLELNLVPSAVLLILPLRNGNPTTTVTSQPNVGFLSGFIWTMFASITSVYNYIRGYFFRPRPRPAPVPQNTESGSTNSQSGANSTERPISRLIQDVPSSPGLARRNVAGGGSTSVRTQGNVHRLHSSGDRDNDENNTWNGNSTQQM